jgi:hypothetical protein
VELSDAVRETFEPFVGTSFALVTEAGEELSVDLVEAVDLGSGGVGQPLRGPFSLLFRAPADAVLPQRIYSLRHPDLGAFDLFLVPVRADERGLMIEAVFT